MRSLCHRHLITAFKQRRCIKSKGGYEKKIGDIEYDSEKVRPEDLIKEIEELGYKASLI